ncbi:GNAT family N-acetyltransferase [Cellulomonas sp. zg-ZUI222]|uniref:GNAT family N-acetyltransferase n=1 Tax=Cellulomonas wangleii TaxID=2816956 RepID=UPI001A9443BB|nr:GNAT family N-acetyltransferase [Cellulomonas wangleii]MBO0922143.1 GNAT family N-acetyltransferase [Cellulomonas wangleii]
MDVQVGEVAPGEVPSCARVIAAALRDDAVVRSLVPGDHDRFARLTSVYAAAVRMALAGRGVVDVARDGPDGPVVGVAMWEGPDHSPGGWPLLRELPGLVRAVGVRRLPASARALRAFAALRPRYPHWFLADVATEPTARGRGVGSALLAHRLALVDTTGLPAYLESTTAASRRLYERFGFRTTGTVRLPGAAATAMVRPAVRDDDAVDR